MVRKRLVVYVSALALVFTVGVPLSSAHASISKCRFDLTQDRFDAVDALINASSNFTRDVTGFIDVDASSTSEITSDYNQSLRDLFQDLRAGRSDIAAARSEAILDMRDECNFSRARFRRELAFYSRQTHRLRRTFSKARAALYQAYVAELAACCVN